MKIGYGAVDITPPLGVELCGYGYFLERRATSVQDRLWARAVCLSQGDQTVLLIVSDLIGLAPDLAGTVQNRLAEQLGLAKTAIMLVCSHTHTGPATVDLIACGEKDASYLAGLADLLVLAGQEAFADQAELIKASYMASEIEPIGFNRVDKSGPVDKYVRGLAFYRAGQRPLALVQHACHPVTLGSAAAISADYPGQVVAALEEQGWAAVFLNGFCGDIDPVSNQADWGSGTKKTITEYGARIATAFLHGEFRDLPIDAVRLDSQVIPVQLELQQYDAAMLEQEYAKYKDKGNSRAVRIWADLQKEKIRTEAEPYLETVSVQVLRLADILLIGFPAEPFTKLGQIMAELLPHFELITLGNCNTSMRYLATEDDIKRQGYGGHTSNFVYGRLPLKAGEAERLARQVAHSLNSSTS